MWGHHSLFSIAHCLLICSPGWDSLCIKHICHGSTRHPKFCHHMKNPPYYLGRNFINNVGTSCHIPVIIAIFGSAWCDEHSFTRSFQRSSCCSLQNLFSFFLGDKAKQ